MKKIKTITVLAIAFCFLLGTTAVYAADYNDEAYNYTLTVSAGNGTIEGDIPSDATVVEAVTTSDQIKVDGTPYDVTPPSKAGKYFVRGLKLAGHDNDELLTSVDITQMGKDTEVVVAYGLRSKMVEYTVSYIDQSGAELVKSDTHYGVIGDRPTVTYKHIDGYLPQSTTEIIDLKPDPASNTITFKYTPVQAGEGNTIVNNNVVAGGGNAAGGNAAGNAAGNAGAAAPGTAIGDADTPLALNDQDTPLAANPDEEESGGPGAFPFIIGGVIAAGIIAAIAAVLARRRGEEDAE